MRIALQERQRDGAVALLYAQIPSSDTPLRLEFATRTGALLRVGGLSAGAFDREHRDVIVPPSASERTLELEVELQALPTNGLPSGPGIAWWVLNLLSRQTPHRSIKVSPAPHDGTVEHSGDLPLIGHSHLDVAWLWTYEQSHRKAQRTFAIACDLLARDLSFRFIQSQPQLYAFVEQTDPQLFERVRDRVKKGRLDASVAALWVESDCNVPSGESLLRQMLKAHVYCGDRFGEVPTVAWLPDSFGFANTLPQLLVHASIPYFATTKLQWNDTTRFPYPQFIWRGPDGSEVIAALLASYDGGAYPWRVRAARNRQEPLVLGYGDGGGGVTPKMLERAQTLGPWIEPRGWFADVAAQRAKLPVHADELYLEYHRGVYTTHHGVKYQNALLERALIEAEELLAWCIAVHAPQEMIAQVQQRLHGVWEIVLRNQFHDVLPGTSIHAVYEDVAREYATASGLAASVIASAQAMLPRSSAARGDVRCAPIRAGEAYLFDNGIVHARLRPDGAIVELSRSGMRNICVRANALALYRDHPKAWEAWNIDDGYQKTLHRPSAANDRMENGVLAIDFRFGLSSGTMRASLNEGEPFLRVELDVEWRERRTLLRVENVLALRASAATYGAPHGTIARSTLADTPARRAQFEVPGQRFAAAWDADGAGAAVLALDTYGWSARDTPQGLHLGHSLLRGTTWPDPEADIGRHQLTYAFLPLDEKSIGGLEQSWLRFAHDPRVRLFACDETSVLVVACKPAEDRDGVVVRVRNCDAQSRRVRLRCGARLTAAHSVNALELPTAGSVEIEGEALVFDLAAFALRSFRVRFSHAA